MDEGSKDALQRNWALGHGSWPPPEDLPAYARSEGYPMEDAPGAPDRWLDWCRSAVARVMLERAIGAGPPSTTSRTVGVWLAGNGKLDFREYPTGPADAQTETPERSKMLFVDTRTHPANAVTERLKKFHRASVEELAKVREDIQDLPSRLLTAAARESDTRAVQRVAERVNELLVAQSELERAAYAAHDARCKARSLERMRRHRIGDYARDDGQFAQQFVTPEAMDRFTALHGDTAPRNRDADARVVRKAITLPAQSDVRMGWRQEDV